METSLQVQAPHIARVWQPLVHTDHMLLHVPHSSPAISHSSSARAWFVSELTCMHATFSAYNLSVLPQHLISPILTHPILHCPLVPCTVLDLSNNYLTGSLPSFFAYDNLHILRLANNSFSGNISNMSSCHLLSDLVSKHSLRLEACAHRQGKVSCLP